MGNEWRKLSNSSAESQCAPTASREIHTIDILCSFNFFLYSPVFGEILSEFSEFLSISKFLIQFVRMREYGLEDTVVVDPKPCSGLREDLKDCLIKSDCVKIHKKSMKDCLKATDGTVPTECALLRRSFFECKRSLLDNRQRFRGRKGY